MKPITEKDVEAALVTAVEANGGTAEKFTSPSRRSVPDRLCTLPNRSMFFVECKKPGEVPTPAQLRDHKRRRDLGQVVFVMHHPSQAGDILESAYILLRRFSD